MGSSHGSGEYGSQYGGLLWAHNGTKVKLWRPDSNIGFLINIGKDWGGGSATYEQHSTEAKVVITVHDNSAPKICEYSMGIGIR